MPSPKLRRYRPPVRTSISQERSVMPIDRGTHHRWKSSGFDQASNTMRAGSLKVLVTTISRSDFRSTAVRFFGLASPSLLASIDLLLPFQFLDDSVQLVEACVPVLAVPLDPGRLFLQSTRADLAGSDAPDLLRGDESGLLQDADVLLHPRERHPEFLGKVRDRGVGTAELLENAASCGIRESGKRVIEPSLQILNHMVQYITRVPAECKDRPSAKWSPLRQSNPCRARKGARTKESRREGCVRRTRPGRAARKRVGSPYGHSGEPR